MRSAAGNEASRHARANWEAYEAGLRAEGEEKGRRGMLLDKLEERFDAAVPEEYKLRVQTADGDQLKKWALRVLLADSLEAVFGEG